MGPFQIVTLATALVIAVSAYPSPLPFGIGTGTVAGAAIGGGGTHRSGGRSGGVLDSGSSEGGSSYVHAATYTGASLGGQGSYGGNGNSGSYGKSAGHDNSGGYGKSGGHGISRGGGGLLGVVSGGGYGSHHSFWGSGGSRHGGGLLGGVTAAVSFNGGLGGFSGSFVIFSEKCGEAGNILRRLEAYRKPAQHYSEVISVYFETVQVVVLFLNAWIPGLGDLYQRNALALMRCAGCEPGYISQRYSNMDLNDFPQGMCTADYGQNLGWEPYASDTCRGYYDFYQVTKIKESMEALFQTVDYSTGGPKFVYDRCMELVAYFDKSYTDLKKDDYTYLWAHPSIIIAGIAESFRSSLGSKVLKSYIGYSSVTAPRYDVDINIWYQNGLDKIQGSTKHDFGGALNTGRRTFRLNHNNGLSSFVDIAYIFSGKHRTNIKALARLGRKAESMNDAYRAYIQFAKFLRGMYNEWISGVGTYYYNLNKACAVITACRPNGRLYKLGKTKGWEPLDICEQYDFSSDAKVYAKFNINVDTIEQDIQALFDKKTNGQGFSTKSEIAVSESILYCARITTKSSSSWSRNDVIQFSYQSALGVAYISNSVNTKFGPHIMRSWFVYVEKLGQRCSISWSSYEQTTTTQVSTVSEETTTWSVVKQSNDNLVQYEDRKQVRQRGSAGTQTNAQSNTETGSTTSTNTQTDTKITQTTNAGTNQETSESTDQNTGGPDSSDNNGEYGDGNDGDDVDYYNDNIDSEDVNGDEETSQDSTNGNDGNDNEQGEGNGDNNSYDDDEDEDEDSDNYDDSYNGNGNNKSRDTSNRRSYNHDDEEYDSNDQEKNSKTNTRKNQVSQTKNTVKTTKNTDTTDENSERDDESSDSNSYIGGSNYSNSNGKGKGNRINNNSNNDEKYNNNDNNGNNQGNRRRNNNQDRNNYSDGNNNDCDTGNGSRGGRRNNNNNRRGGSSKNRGSRNDQDSQNGSSMSVFQQYAQIFKDRSVKSVFTSLSKKSTRATGFNGVIEMLTKVTRGLSKVFNGMVDGRSKIGYWYNNMMVGFVRVACCNSNGPIAKAIKSKRWDRPDVCQKTYGQKWGLRKYTGNNFKLSTVVNFYDLDNARNSLEDLLDSGDLQGETEKLIVEKYLEILNLFKRDVSDWTNDDVVTVIKSFTTITAAVVYGQNSQLGKRTATAIYDHFSIVEKTLDTSFSSARSETSETITRATKTNFRNTVIYKYRNSGYNSNGNGGRRSNRDDGDHDDDDDDTNGNDGSDYDTDENSKYGKNKENDKRSGNGVRRMNGWRTGGNDNDNDANSGRDENTDSGRTKIDKSRKDSDDDDSVTKNGSGNGNSGRGKKGKGKRGNRGGSDDDGDDLNKKTRGRGGRYGSSGNDESRGGNKGNNQGRNGGGNDNRSGGGDGGNGSGSSKGGGNGGKNGGGIVGGGSNRGGNGGKNGGGNVGGGSNWGGNGGKHGGGNVGGGSSGGGNGGKNGGGNGGSGSSGDENGGKIGGGNGGGGSSGGGSGGKHGGGSSGENGGGSGSGNRGGNGGGSGGGKGGNSGGGSGGTTTIAGQSASKNQNQQNYASRNKNEQVQQNRNGNFYGTAHEENSAGARQHSDSSQSAFRASQGADGHSDSQQMSQSESHDEHATADASRDKEISRSGDTTVVKEQEQHKSAASKSDAEKSMTAEEHVGPDGSWSSSSSSSNMSSSSDSSSSSYSSTVEVQETK